jgi:hypothetical protein
MKSDRKSTDDRLPMASKFSSSHRSVASLPARCRGPHRGHHGKLDNQRQEDLRRMKTQFILMIRAFVSFSHTKMHITISLLLRQLNMTIKSVQCPYFL